jgi:glycosyltransferase involved in cell wall biosynthesis
MPRPSAALDSRPRVSVSIIILAHNEERDLPRLLESIRWCDDVHLVDSGSTDATINIARDAAIHCHQHPFVSFAEQRNWALENCGVRHSWVLFLDADEASTAEFQQSVLNAVKRAADSTAGFYCCWKLIVEDRWLKRCDSFPKWQLRLLRRGRVDFVDFGHGQKEGKIDGVLEYVHEPYLHYGLSKGWTNWLERHNRYATQEAAVRLQAPVNWKEIFARDPSVRNKALKPLVSRIPGWPLMRFLLAYVFSGGFLEGKPGFIYSVNLGYYEFLIRVKQREMRRATRA